MMFDKEITQVGSVSDTMGRWITSPDGMIDENGVLEIKCLPKNHISALLYYSKHGKAPPDYIQQTQGQLFVTEREYVDLLYYHPDLPKIVIRQYPDEKIQTALEQQLKACITERNLTLNILKEIA